MISGNGSDGIIVISPGSDYNVFAGNFIGTDITGTKALGNLGRGIKLEGAHGSTASARTEATTTSMRQNGT